MVKNLLMIMTVAQYHYPKLNQSLAAIMTVVATTAVLLKNHAVTKKLAVAVHKKIKSPAVTKVSPKIRLMPAVPPHLKLLQNSRAAVIKVAVSTLLHPKHHAVVMEAAVATKLIMMPLEKINLAAREAFSLRVAMTAAQKKWTKNVVNSMPTRNAALLPIAFASR